MAALALNGVKMDKSDEGHLPTNVVFIGRNQLVEVSATERSSHGELPGAERERRHGASADQPEEITPGKSAIRIRGARNDWVRTTAAGIGAFWM